MGVDGEGAGIDRLGRQNYLLLRAGNENSEAELFADNNRLSTVACLEFLLSLPANAILVGYFFTYDATQILRDLPAERIARLFEPQQRGEGHNSYTWWHEYGIDFRPRQYFRVCRLQSRDNPRVVPGSARTVNEVGGFFQKSFVEALRDWQVGDKPTVDMIAANKDRRSEFVRIGQTERDYCAAECKMLAQLMEKLRETCGAVDIVPRQWRGAGHISARLHEIHRTPKRTERDRPATLDRIAEAAYYGGRFEITRLGRIPGPVYEYDINSAYPAAMLTLPCPVHTKWKKFPTMPPDRCLSYVAKIHFKHSHGANLCGFPVRRKGRLFWPREAQGIYWKIEIDAAIQAGAEIVKYEGGYAAIKNCECDFFRWVNELYLYRKKIGKATLGYPIKLGLNGLYGKLAQRIGAAPWRDHILAGMITAYTRAKLISGYASDPGAVVMLATDALYSVRPLPVDVGDQLGQWECKERDGLFVVQPGIYWSPGSAGTPKTRGIPRSVVIEYRDQFERAFDDWCAGNGSEAPPVISVPVQSFVGHRIALHRNKPELAGCWLVVDKHIDFDWKNKRVPNGAVRDGSIYTKPFDGNSKLITETYNGDLLSDIQMQLMETEAAPDFAPWGNSGE